MTDEPETPEVIGPIPPENVVICTQAHWEVLHESIARGWDLARLVKKIDAAGAILSAHAEFCVATDECPCLADASDLEELLEKWIPAGLAALVEEHRD